MLVRAEGEYVAVKIRLFPVSKLRSAGKLHLLALRVEDKSRSAEAGQIKAGPEIIRLVRTFACIADAKVYRKSILGLVKTGGAGSKHAAPAGKIMLQLRLKGWRNDDGIRQYNDLVLRKVAFLVDNIEQ